MEGWLGPGRLGFSGFHLLNHFAQLFQGNILYLPHAFASNTEFLSHFFECLLRPAIKSETCP